MVQPYGLTNMHTNASCTKHNLLGDAIIITLALICLPEVSLGPTFPDRAGPGSAR